MTQPNLWDRHRNQIEEDYRAFHQAHPEVYRELVALCRQWRSRGRSRWSIDGAFEVLRWQRHILGLPDPREDFKLNNNYRAHYARQIMNDEPDLADLFEVRRLREVPL